MAVASRPLGQHLVGRGVITDEQLEWALKREATEGTPLAGVLLTNRLATEQDLLSAAAALSPPAGAAPADGAATADLRSMLAQVVALGGSDLHLTAGLAPSVRVNGEITTLDRIGPLAGTDIDRLVLSVLTDKQRALFQEELELDTSYSEPGIGRFRVNVFQQRDSLGAVMRVIPFQVPAFESLGLPPVVASFAQLPRGLVLVTGPTGSGKSTTLASLIDIINSTRPGHIMTIEDPIEFLHVHKRSIVNQREVGHDTHSFGGALKHVLRQDPDVILVGEMRDLETVSTALTAAETGHLVFGTLHTQSAPQSVDRIIDVFPAHQQDQIRSQLATTLQGVLTQQLVPSANGSSRVLACEVLVATPAIRNLIREAKIHQIPSAIQSGLRYGMQTMDTALAQLVHARAITMDAALDRCHSGEDLRRLMANG
jgi:twitching motility protein PilT